MSLRPYWNPSAPICDRCIHLKKDEVANESQKYCQSQSDAGRSCCTAILAAWCSWMTLRWKRLRICEVIVSNTYLTISTCARVNTIGASDFHCHAFDLFVLVNHDLFQDHVQ